jgi:hypothetical protein
MLLKVLGENVFIWDRNIRIQGIYFMNDETLIYFRFTRSSSEVLCTMKYTLLCNGAFSVNLIRRDCLGMVSGLLINIYREKVGFLLVDPIPTQCRQTSRDKRCLIGVSNELLEVVKQR